MAYDREHFEAMSCPSNVTWTNDIEKMFTPLDIDHMKTRGVDLSSYDSVKINAVAIYTRVKSGSMPPPGSGEDRWSTDMVNIFGCWIQQSTPQ